MGPSHLVNKPSRGSSPLGPLWRASPCLGLARSARPGSPPQTHPEMTPCPDAALKLGEPREFPWLFFLSESRPQPGPRPSPPPSLDSCLPQAQGGEWGDGPSGCGAAPGELASASQQPCVSLSSRSASVASLCVPAAAFWVRPSAPSLLGASLLLGWGPKGWPEGQEHRADAWPGGVWETGEARAHRAGTRASGAQSHPEPRVPRGFLDEAGRMGGEGASVTKRRGWALSHWRTTRLGP